MHRIAIISSSIRVGRKSHNVALFLKQFIEGQNWATIDLIDLLEYHFPLFEERLSYIKDPSPEMTRYAETIKCADGIIIVTPEYNGGYPASLKNAIDLLYPEWKRKPVGMVSVSNGQYGGSQCLTTLGFTLTKMGATVVPNMFRVSYVQDVYNDDGTLIKDEAVVTKQAKPFVEELRWYIESKKNAVAQ